QCVIYLWIGNAVLEIRQMFTIHLLWMFLTSLTGACMGLLVSSIVHDSRTALNIIPLLLIPQIILGGALIKYEEMNRNLDFVYSIRRWVDNKSGDDSSAASKLKVPLICQFMPLRWSYESVIISQAKLNPLTRSQEFLENRIQSLIPPAGEQMTTLQRQELDRAKQALAVVSGLQDNDADDITRRLNRIQEGIESGKIDPELLDPPKGRRTISAEEIFVNRKVLDLVTKAEMEREDYRRTFSPNVFFGTVRTYPLFTPAEAVVEKPAARRDSPKPWYQEIRIETLTLNATVMILTLGLVIGVLQFSLRRQLSRV
ncbi:MAG: ABC transporter permease, partial [Verrucomicrobia bacterium]|nr:ABC transporter permease [Verrucomicrobiota bacterium]